MTNNKQVYITKQSGEQEVFSPEKLKRSLQRAGADEQSVQRIVANVEQWLFEGASTKQIYGRAHHLLHKVEKSAFRYRLKQAIYDLGPTGYPFEFLVGEIYKRKGWDVEVGQVLQGASVTHEMDVIATKDKVQHLIECKYHKDQGKQVSVQVPLYVRSRVNDIVEYRQKQEEYAHLEFVAGVATNTRFSEDSTHYGEYAGLSLMSWDYPKGNGLKDYVERFFIYPITILKDLEQQEKIALLNRKIILCYQLDAQRNVLNEIGISKTKIKAILKELDQIAEQSPFF